MDEGQEEEMKRKSNVKAGGRKSPDQDPND
jgi:hypothetical protein